MNEENKTEVSHNIEQPKTDTQADLFVVYEKELASASSQAKEDMKLIQSLLNQYGGNFQKEMLQYIVSSDFQKWITTESSGFEKNISSMTTFIDEKLDTQSQFAIGELKTYVESQNTIVKRQDGLSEDLNNLQEKNTTKNKLPEIGELSKNIDEYAIQISKKKVATQGKEVATQGKEVATLKENNEAEGQKVDTEKHLDQILSDISTKLSLKTPEIIVNPVYQAEKTKFEQQVGKKVDDGYFVSRFALNHAGEVNGYLTQMDLGGESKTDLIARLNQKYQINEIIALQDNTFRNTQFDGRISAETQTQITEKGSSFDNVFSAAELEFYKENSPLRTTLDHLTLTTLFPGAKNTNPSEYRSEQVDGKVWMPVDHMKTKDSFSAWIATLHLDAKTNDILLRQQEVYSKLKETYKNVPPDMSPEQHAHKQWMTKFETNMALIASQNRRKDVEAEASKSMAERIFQDVDALIRPEQGTAEKWKIIPQQDKSPFAIDAQGNITINYELDGAKGKIVVQKDGSVTVTDWFAQKDGFKDLFRQEKKVGKIQGIDSYLATIKSHMPTSPEQVKEEMRNAKHPFAKEIKSLVRQEPESLSATKASVNHTIASQDIFNAILTQTNTLAKYKNPATTTSIDLIQQRVNTGLTDTPVIAFQNAGNQGLLFDIRKYCEGASQTEIRKKQREFTAIASWIDLHKDDPIAQDLPLLKPTLGIKKQSDGLLNTLSQMPLSQRRDASAHLEHSYQKARNEDNDKKESEMFLDNYDKTLDNVYG